MEKKNMAFGLGYTLSGLITAFFLSWLLLAHFNFLYGFWHDRVGIGAGIEEFGPQNRYREGFAETTRDERVRLFREINEAVHNGGEGLASIRYHARRLPEPQPLLRRPEILHLQDVARLITLLKWLSLTAVGVWLGCAGWAIWRRRHLPSLRAQVTGIGGGLLLSGLGVLLIGPVRVFNQLHIWIFPADHPWFFYYQDSLMSTMMMAPSLFGWITLAWLPLALSFFFALHFLTLRMRRARVSPLAP